MKSWGDFSLPHEIFSAILGLKIWEDFLMNCFVCGGEMVPFMEKFFGMKNLDACEYVRCENCGLVIAKTLYEMPRSTWEALNRECHAAYQNTDTLDVDPNWLPRLKAQAEVLSELINFGVLDKNTRAVDYGAGDGKLSAFVSDKNWLKKFDAYMSRPNENYLRELTPASFDFVITCSVFEHLLGAQDVEKIFALLKSNGTAALHTLICEEIPRDPNWFYLQPVHCTFWTNAAMQKIFTQYKFKACAYHVEARLWFMFRDLEKFSRLKTCAEKIFGTWVFANDFVDYWKVKPYRK